MRRVALLTFAIICIFSASAQATDSVLSHDKGTADTYEKLTTDGHYITFNSPAWPHTFAGDVQVYGYRYGEVGNTMGTVVVWDVQPLPKPAKPPKAGAKPAPTKQAHIITSRQFKLSDAPEKAGWFSVSLDASELPRSFGVTVFTRSSDTAGLWVGLSAKSKEASYSSAGIISELGSASRIKMRRDGRNWLVRLNVRDAIKSQTAFTTEQVTGKNFAALDDGAADGFATAQKDGPIVRFSSDGTRRLRRVYVYAKLDGTGWFNTDRMGGVWVLNENYGILCHANIAHKQFTNEPSWASLDLPDIVLPKTFYVLVEPVSRPQSQLLVGFDSSGKNRGSLFGSAGALHKWNIQAPEDKVNWMIRVEYR